jgi:hypothetical protein
MRNHFLHRSFLSVLHSYSFSIFDMVSEHTENPNSSSAIINDFFDSLFLHHGDGPSSILVSQPLISENYNSWSRLMLIALNAKNKICLIDGSMPKPYDSSSNFNA